VMLQRADARDEVLVTIPPGVRRGTRLRLRGKGRPRPDGGRGDTYLVVDVAGEGA
jgi:DnaJ-class molecular chaperone